MDLSIVVDRGDVWYDLPFDDAGNFKLQPRKSYPTLTLYVTHGGKTFPLARWRTTIGGWRAEQATDGYEYFRYKMSDVGPRVIRRSSRARSGSRPPSTPIRTLVKGKIVNGRWSKVVNYDELGPGLSVGVRRGRRLLRHPGAERAARLRQRRARARLVGLPVDLQPQRLLARLPPPAQPHRGPALLVHPRHRTEGRAGDQPLDFSRQFLCKETVYEMRMPSRGYAY